MGLDGFTRKVSKEDARAMIPGQQMPQWKFTSSQSQGATRMMAEWVILDGLHTTCLEGEGITKLLKVLEPRFVPPCRATFTHV